MKNKDLVTAIVIIVVLYVLFVFSDARANALDEFNGQTYSPEPPQTIGFVETGWTGWNKFLFGSYVATNISDVYTSQEAFDRGCEEGNPLMPESTGGMILTKVVAGTAIYYITEKFLVPAYGTDSRNWIYGIGTVLFGAVSVSNNGCGR